MSKPASIQISIPHPCTQSWDEMTANGRGRHCTQCQKTVMDFSTWSDAALHTFFTKNGPVCGRFLSTQLYRPIHMPPQPHSKLYRIALALGLTILAAQGPAASARPRPPLTEQSAFSDSPDSTPQNAASARASITGKVVDERNEPMVYATVLVYRDTVQMGGVATDINGKYCVTGLQPGAYDITVAYVGYSTNTKKDVQIGQGNTILDFSMAEHVSTIMLGGPMIRQTRGNKHNRHKRANK